MNQPTLEELNASFRGIFFERIDLFAEFVLPEHCFLKTPSFHLDLYSSYRNKDNKYTAIAAPRGFSKSSTLDLVYLLWAIAYKQEEFILLISDTFSQATLFLETLKSELEGNEKFIALYGDLTTTKWAQDDIETSNGVRIMAKGQGMKVRGLKYGHTRPTLAIMDDIENDELVESKERREKLERWLNAALVPSLAQDGRIICIGTILSFDSLLWKLTKEDEYTEWNKRIYRALDTENNTTLWPERYSVADLEEIKRQYASKGQLSLFYSEYMNDPIDAETQEFKRTYFKYCDLDDIGTQYKIFVTCDPALSQEKTADYTAFCVVAVNDKNNWYVIEIIRERMDAPTMIETIFQLYEKYEFNLLGFEEGKEWLAIKPYFEQEQKARNKFIPLQLIKPIAGKYSMARVKGLSPRYKIGQIHHIKGAPGIIYLEDELLQFPKAKNDDVCDSLSMMNFITYKAEPEKTKAQVIKNYIKSQQWILDPVTGY